ncbi:MAG TPA: sodium:solute symporter family protein [Candidatus Saccharimonadales bacterium]|jgi:SSS family solute:Na+ symporter|nr:sodium:solute symporter family protein [Candidatus Saccharimonadales bacterium]
MNPYLIGLLAYSSLLMAVGIAMGRRIKAAPDFLVAGRRLGPGLVFTTFLAANLGAGSTVGATGLGYRFGLSAWWWVGSASIGTFILAMLLGPRLWEIAQRHSLHTMGDFLEWRYGKAVKAVIALLLWFGTLAILAGQLIAISWILNVVIGLPKWAGCAIGGAVAIVYCSAGGLMAAAFVNVIELTITMSGLLLAVPFALASVGGWGHLTQTVAASTSSSTPLLTITGVGLKQILTYLAILVPSFIVSPGLTQKLYGARDRKTVRLGVGLNSLAQAGFAFVPAVLGLCALAAYPHLGNPELALPTVVMKLLPPWLGIWALASIFSAELSATDAILFMLSTSVAVDLYKTFLNPQVTDRKLLSVSRAMAIVAGILGVLLAMLLPSVIAAVKIFYGLLAVSLFAPVVLGLYWRGATSRAALASIAGAVGATLAISRFTKGTGVWLFSPEAIGIGTAFVILVLVSLHQRARLFSVR